MQQLVNKNNNGGIIIIIMSRSLILIQWFCYVKKLNKSFFRSLKNMYLGKLYLNINKGYIYSTKRINFV